MPTFRLIVLALLLIAVAALATAPAPVLALSSRQATPPPQAPQPLAGRQLYAQNCAPCHGTTGKGDGPSASGLSVPPTAFANYDVMAGLPLTELFNITKNGNMQRMMPPWKNRLNDQQIWDAVGYAWTLHTSADELAAGKAIYEKQCVTCHGPDGKGKAPTPDLTDFTKTSAASQKAWSDLLAKGRSTMPAFGDKLNQTEQRAVLEYARSLSFGPMVRAPLGQGAGVITGTVANRSNGQVVPNAAVELAIFDDMSLLETRKATTDASGLYRFTDLPTDPSLAYVTRVAYPAGGINYNSEPAQFPAGQSALNLPITVFETTADPSGVRADRVHYIVEFDNDRALIAEMIVFSLAGNKAYTGDGTGVLRFTLPPGAEDVQIEGGELGGRYLPTPDGFVDTLPLEPGQGTQQILYRYSIPFTRNTLDLVRSLVYPATNVNALVADVGAKVTSEQLRDQTVRQTQGGNFISLSGQNLAANQPINLRFSDLPLGVSSNAVATDVPKPATSDRALLLIFIGVVGLVAALLVALPLLRRQSAPAAAVATDQDSLVDALARLDVAYQAGGISEAAYRDQRLRLKAQLVEAVRKDSAA
ncbi:MAG: c-type cytochrome [Anaerolineae bacterium]|nr:c-type cytochrome [Anaerolineae bacterium]